MLVKLIETDRSGPLHTSAFWSPDAGTLEVHCALAPVPPSNLAERLDALLEIDDTEVIVIGDLEWIQGPQDGLRALSTRVLLLDGDRPSPEALSPTPRPVDGALRLEVPLDVNRRATFDRPVEVRGRTAEEGTIDVEIRVTGEVPIRWLTVGVNLSVGVGAAGELVRIYVTGVVPLEAEVLA